MVGYNIIKQGYPESPFTLAYPPIILSSTGCQTTHPITISGSHMTIRGKAIIKIKPIN
jgi:hypothetical protein